MTKGSVFREIQKHIEKLLLGYGFKKEKFGFQKDFGESVCVLFFHKPRNENGEEVIAWQLLGGIWFKALDRFFRPGCELKQSEPDVYLYDGFPPVPGRMQPKIWRVTGETCVSSFSSEFQKLMAPGLEAVGDFASMTSFVRRYDEALLTKSSELSINGLVKAAIGAKISGLEAEYNLLKRAIEQHQNGNSWFARHHLGLLAA